MPAVVPSTRASAVVRAPQSPSRSRGDRRDLVGRFYGENALNARPRAAALQSDLVARCPPLVFRWSGSGCTVDHHPRSSPRYSDSLEGYLDLVESSAGHSNPAD